MSVLIKGMEMPKAEFGSMIVAIHPDGRVEDVMGCYVGKAVPVTPHGRLIDADAVERNLLKMQQAQTGPCSHGVRKSRAVLRDAPTIIEAEWRET